MKSEGERRLVAIMFTDIVGYTALTQRSESETMRLLDEHRKLVRPLFTSHGGREIKTIGDAFLVEFGSALEATLCAVAVQSAMNDRKLSRGEGLSVRIGVHVGDVIQKENDVFGDAVNIASRIEPLAEPGGVCVSEQVYDQVKNKVPYSLTKIEVKGLKNVSEPVEVYKVILPWERQSTGEEGVFPRDRIAILPLRNMSPDPNDEYFAEGMTEEIISTVSGISGLKVISRTSVMGYKGTTKKVKEIGKELEVGSVLEGSFRKAGNRIRVTTQLIDVADDEHLWAQNYDRNLDDIFEVQSDVAKQVADALRVKILSPEKERIERKPTENTAAYTLYLKGRSLWNTRGLEDLKKAKDYFELAVHEDPAFALGYAGLADCFILFRNNWDIDPVENLAKAKAMADKALQLDPKLAEAHPARGFVYYGEYDLRSAEGEFKKAIELKPSYATAHQWYFWVLRAELRWDEALKEIETAAELDPLSAVIVKNLGDYYSARRDFSKAAEKYRAAIELGGDGYRNALADAYGMLKMFDEMEKENDAAVRYAQNIWPSIRIVADSNNAYHRGDKEKVRRILPELEARSKEVMASATYIAALHFFLGDVDSGFEWLERAYSRREGSVLDIQWYWDFDGVRTDPRYLDLLKRLGLT